jgi:sugar phosphate isomerase/epimerase
MLKGLTRAGLGNIGDDKRFIQLAAEYGFESVDLDAKNLIDTYGLEESKKLLENHGMVIGSIGLPVEWRQTNEQFQQGIVQLASVAEAAAQLGCTRCCTYILPSTDYKSASFMAIAVKRLRVCAEIIGTYGLSLGLEFVGPHHLRTAWANPYIWTLEETLELIDAIGRPNVGLLLDAYHWYTTGLTTEDISNLKESQIVHVHINDAKDIQIEELKDNDRLYPGEGVIDIVSFLRSVQQTGYRGPVAQEILSPEPPAATAEELLSRSKVGFDKIFKSLS